MNDIAQFKNSTNVDKVIVLWTANTECFCNVVEGINDTAQNLKVAIAKGHSEISPSVLFAYASIAMGCTYINGSPQNTFVPGVIDFAEKQGVFIAGDDFKSGQTKIKSVLVDFLVGAGIKPVSIVSYNHLGNNDGKNLSAPEQFRSKEVSNDNYRCKEVFLLILSFFCELFLFFVLIKSWVKFFLSYFCSLMTNY